MGAGAGLRIGREPGILEIALDQATMFQRSAKASDRGF